MIHANCDGIGCSECNYSGRRCDFCGGIVNARDEDVCFECEPELGQTHDFDPAFWLLLKTGGDCPTCLRTAKLHVRPLGPAHAFGLIALAEATSDIGRMQAEKVPGIAPKTQRQIPSLRYWNLVKRAKLPSDLPETADYFRVTPLGRAFVAGTVRIMKFAIVYDDAVYGRRGPLIDIDAALEGKRFSKAELLRAEATEIKQRRFDKREIEIERENEAADQDFG